MIFFFFLYIYMFTKKYIVGRKKKLKLQFITWDNRKLHSKNYKNMLNSNKQFNWYRFSKAVIFENITVLASSFYRNLKKLSKTKRERRSERGSVASRLLLLGLTIRSLQISMTRYMQELLINITFSSGAEVNSQIHKCIRDGLIPSTVTSVTLSASGCPLSSVLPLLIVPLNQEDHAVMRNKC